MGDPVDLQQVIRAVDDGVDRERPPADRKPAREAPDGLDPHVDGRAVGLDLVTTRTGLRDGETVGLPSVAEIDRAADLVARSGPAAIRGGVEGSALELLLGVVDVDGGGEQGDVGVARWQVATRGDEAVQPSGVGRAGDHLRAVEQVEQERLVRRPATHHHARLRQGTAHTRPCLGAVAPPADDLGEHWVVFSPDAVTLGQAGLDPYPRPGGQPQELDDPGRRERSPVRDPQR